MKMKNQNFKNHYVARFEKKILTFPTLAPLYKIFRNISILSYMYSIFMLTFKNLKQILKIFFLVTTRIILEEKKHILAIFFIIFQKNYIISDVINPIAAILKLVFYHFFCNIQSMTVSNFMSKSFSYLHLGRGWHYVPPQRHDQEKIPRAR